VFVCLEGRKKKRLEQKNKNKNPKQKNRSDDFCFRRTPQLLLRGTYAKKVYLYIYKREREKERDNISKCNRYSPNKFQHLMLLLVQEDPVVIKTSRQS